MGTQRISRHNGRSGKSGTYSSKHNDRQFDAENAEHISTTRMQQNIYWDYLNGERTHAEQQKGAYPTFQAVEKQFYAERYAGYLAGQAERNRKSGHSNRNRTVDDLLHDKRICPEETIYQIGKEGSETPPEVLLDVIHDYHNRFNQRFGEHVHIIDWALHLDETTPHVHERHVFDMANGHGEIEPKQEKTLELMGIPRPKPEEKPGKFNNRKMTFDAICREMFIRICKEHGLSIEEEPIYGGQAYREKNDYIIESQRTEIAEQQQTINSLQAEQQHNAEILTRQQAQIANNAALLEEEERLIEKVSTDAYDKAIHVITEATVRETQDLNTGMLMRMRDESTAPERKRNVELHLKPHLNKVQICALRPDDVQKVIKKLNGEDLSAKTIKNILSCLHQALDYAVDNQLIPFNPASRRKLPKIVKKEIKPLDKPEQALFFSAIKGDEYECLYTVAVFTGMRSGELLGLTWNNIDFRNGTITVCQQLRPPRLEGESYTIDTTKNGKTRVLTPAPSIMQMLKEHRKEQAEIRLQLGDKYNTDFPNLVFTYPDGRHLTQVHMWKNLQKVLHNAGLDPHRFHDLRHTYAVDCCMAGDDPKTVQDNLGHATSQFTLEVYAHTTETMKKESANRMEAFINSLHEDRKKQSETG